MAATVPPPANINEYIAAASPSARPILREIRKVIRAAAPDAEETISYRMPAFRQNGILLYFAAFTNHIGVFPPVSGDERLERAVAPYAGPKGNLRFPMDSPIPYDLIRRIVKLRLKQNRERSGAKRAAGAKPPDESRKSAAGRRTPASAKRTVKTRAIHPDTRKYNEHVLPAHRDICNLLAIEIGNGLPTAENRIWHSHPVWFLDGNPIVGYSVQKAGVRLMFWSGADFDEPGLNVVGKKFKDASVFYNDASEVRKTELRRWLRKAKAIQWDYKNIVRRRGRLERIE